MSKFNKIFKSTTQQFKELINIMIKNENIFCIFNTDINYNENLTIYTPSNEELYNYLTTIYTSNFKYKELPFAALENMKKKGIQPKKQASELILIFITGSNTHVHYSLSIPKNLNININEFMYNLSFDIINDNDKSIVIYGSKECDTPFKEKDNVQQYFIKKLSENGFYNEDDSDDDELNDFNDILM